MSYLEPKRFDSPLTRDGVDEWLADRREASHLLCQPIRLDEVSNWSFSGGCIAHTTGRYFSISGFRAVSDGSCFKTQPLIVQPEIGILGFLLRINGSRAELLCQAKAEPGNIHAVQLAPTVQATESNYQRVHGGAPTRYLDYFTAGAPQRELSNVLQSEQGTRFLGKYNRNTVVLVPDAGPQPFDDNWRWIDMADFARLLSTDFAVNTDARSVLACTDWTALTPGRRPFERLAETDSFASSLSGSFQADETDAVLRTDEITRRLEDRRQADSFELFEVPLDDLGWSLDEWSLVDPNRNEFAVCAYRVSVDNREVHDWDQPLVQSLGLGTGVLLCQNKQGTLHFLFDLKQEIGFREFVQLAPTIQDDGKANSEDGPAQLRARFGLQPDDYVQQITSLQSDEGGRFYRTVCRYEICLVNDDVEVPINESQCWMTLAQVYALLRTPGVFNNEARSAISLLLSYL